MAKVQEIEPYSAYAIAVKYGYKGTEEEWVKEQEANRKAAEAAAAAAAQSAKDAAASASGAAQSGQQAVQSIKDAQTSAEQAIDTAKQQAVQAAQAEAEKAATSARQAASSAAEAAQSATSAAAEVGKVQNAGTTAVQAVQAAQNTATGAVADAQQTATQAVSQAQTTAVSAVQAEGTKQTNAVAAAASSALKGISDAKDAALSNVAEAGEAQVSAVGTAGTSAVKGVNDAKTAALKEIEDANAALPNPTQADSGKVPTVKADGSAYELAGPYAPLSAAIRPTASGNPVSITDTVEWPLQGLTVYGKSTQITTTGAQLFDPVTDAFISNTDGTNTASLDCEATDYIEIGEHQKVYVSIDNYNAGSPHNYALRIGKYRQDKTWIGNNVILSGAETAISVSGEVAYIRASKPKYARVMLSFNSGSPYEPYTGGKPSPSPEYPQPIVSAGDTGSIILTMSDGADQSQSLTVSTPNGLPGIPVDSGGNYTDAEGQQWVCDEVDFARGVYVQRCVTEKITGTPNFHETPDYQNRYKWQLYNISVFADGGVKALSSFAPWSSWGIGPNDVIGFAISEATIYYYEKDTTAEAVNALFTKLIADKNCVVMGQLENPVETPLSGEELAAYRALHTYDGSTVVSTTEDVAGLEVKYLADVEKYIDRKISEAITSAAATQLASYDALSGSIREGVNEA